MMSSLNISLPEPMRAWIDQQVAKGGYSTASEFLRELVREAQKREAQERLERLLLEGLDSGEPIELTDERWERLRKRVSARVQQGVPKE